MKDKNKSKKKIQKKLTNPVVNVTQSPLVIGVMGFGPFLIVAILFGVLIYSAVVDNTQKKLVSIDFDSKEKVDLIARTILEDGDVLLAQKIYSKMIDGINMTSNKYMSTEMVDDIILSLNPKTEVFEDIRTKTMMSETIKSKALYLRLAKLFADLGLWEKSAEAEKKALEIDPIN